MNCSQAQRSFSAYLDGAISGQQMAQVATHLAACTACTQDFAALRHMQTLLSNIGPVKAPADLGLRLRLAVSHETARRSSRWTDSFSVRWDNILRPALLRASAGFACALLLIGSITLLVGMVAVPQAVEANDEPLGALTAPHYLYSAAPAQSVSTADDSIIVIRASLNAKGRVFAYTILSGPQDDRIDAQVRTQLMLQQYEPA